MCRAPPPPEVRLAESVLQKSGERQASQIDEISSIWQFERDFSGSESGQ
jgi:hypothetical protein